MSDRHQRNISGLQEKLVELRRQTIELALSGSLSVLSNGDDAVMKLERRLLGLQNMIDALDRAFEDEKKRRPEYHATMTDERSIA